MRFILTLLLFSSLQLSAQTPYRKVQWKERPVLHTVPEKFREEAAVYVTDAKRTEFSIEKDGFYAYRTIHRIIHINTDKGIEYFNKVYLPFDEGVQMMEVKARTILPDGKIIEFNEKNIKDLKEDDSEYKIFALDGLTKGCDVEYFYTIKKQPSLFGREIISSNVPVMESRFELVTPDHLKFDFRNYNNLPPTRDTAYDGKRYYSLVAQNLIADEEEKYSMFNANKKRVEYKLSYNQAKSSTERMYTWNELAKKAFQIYTEVSEKELKKVNDLVEAAGVKASMAPEAKILLLENYLKKNFVSREDIPDEDADDLTKVIRNKVASERAFCKLFAAALKVASVEYQLVLSGDRSDYTIDKNLENWNNAQHILFYFPATKKFLAPTATVFRYPWIPPTWTNTNGLFCVSTTLGGLTTAYAEIRSIPLEDYKHSFQNLEIKAGLDKSGDAVELDVKQLYGGYTAANYRAPFVFYPAEEQKKLLKELVKNGTGSENILSHTFENKELEQKDPYLPFVIQAKVRSTQLVEKAGNKIIVKIGDFIGAQTEMYDTKERTTDIDVSYPHSLVRHIEFAIPEGYEIKNLKDLQFNEVYKDGDKLTMGFVSTYEVDGNKLKITIREEYVNCLYPMQQYNAFKKVINAAADFNKVVLVMDKKAS